MSSRCDCIGMMRHAKCPEHGPQVKLAIAVRRKKFRAVKVRFGVDDDEESFPAYTDDTYWNGFLNVWVSANQHKVFNDRWEELPLDEDEYGLVYYGGGAVIVQEVT